MNRGEYREQILKGINSALKSRKLYPPGHPAIITPVRKVFNLIGELLKDQNALLISRLNDTLVFDDQPLFESEKNYQEIIHRMRERNIEVIVLERGISEQEFTDFIDMLLEDNRLTARELNEALKERGITHISLKSLEKRKEIEVYNDAVRVIRSVMSDIRLGRIPETEPVKEIVEDMTSSILADPNALIGLSMIKSYDNYLYNHSVNVSILAISLGRIMGLSDDDLRTVGISALLHDIGKTGIAEDIIKKPGGLSSEEWEKIKQHPVLGKDITRKMGGMSEDVGRMIYEHHIRYDHSGYPKTTSSLHPLSQIITISDAYDALTTLRVYQRARTPSEALGLMMSLSGRHFDPKVFKTFMDMIGLYPVGTMVRLTTNEIGVVIRTPQDTNSGITVKVLYDKNCKPVEEPFEVTIGNKEQERSILSTVEPALLNIDVGMLFKEEAEKKGD